MLKYLNRKWQICGQVQPAVRRLVYGWRAAQTNPPTAEPSPKARPSGHLWAPYNQAGLCKAGVSPENENSRNPRNRDLGPQ